MRKQFPITQLTSGEVVVSSSFPFAHSGFIHAQAARFTKKDMEWKWRPCLGGGLVCVKFFLPCSKFTGQNVFWTVQSSCGVYRASCASSCIEIKVRSVCTGGPSARWEEIIKWYVNETYANVTLAFERCCVTKMRFTRVCMGILRVCFKIPKM